MTIICNISLIFVLFFITFLGGGNCQYCASTCHPPECSCPRFEYPMETKQIPQMVYFGFDDAVNSVMSSLYDRLFTGDVLNPNGCPIKMSLFVSHQYTDYTRVKRFHARGMEIGVHSVTHTSIDNDEILRREAKQQKENLIKLAGIPETEIIGWRSPFLKTAGNNQPRILHELGYEYDISLTYSASSYETPKPWPFTMERGWPYRCGVIPCPVHARERNFWAVPVVSLVDHKGMYGCSFVDGCVIPADNEDEAFKYLWKNFESYYNGSRAPFGLNMHAAWFYTRYQLTAMMRFLEELSRLDDVYVLTVKQVLDWMKHPTPLSDIATMQSWGCTDKPGSRTTRRKATTTKPTIKRPMIKRRQKSFTRRRFAFIPRRISSWFRPITHVTSPFRRYRYMYRANTTSVTTTASTTHKTTPTKTTHMPSVIKSGRETTPTTKGIETMPTTSHVNTITTPTTSRVYTTAPPNIPRVYITATPSTPRVYTTTTPTTSRVYTTAKPTASRVDTRTTPTTSRVYTTAMHTTSRARTTTTPTTSRIDTTTTPTTSRVETTTTPMPTIPRVYTTATPTTSRVDTTTTPTKSRVYTTNKPTMSLLIKSTDSTTTAMQTTAAHATRTVRTPYRTSLGAQTARSVTSTSFNTGSIKPPTTTVPSSQPPNWRKYSGSRREPAPDTCLQGDNCHLPDCYCQTEAIPGELHHADTPQMVYLAIDGSVNPGVYRRYRQMFRTLRNPNNCRARGTLFTTGKGTYSFFLRRVVALGAEVAMRGINNQHFKNVEQMESEVTQQKRQLKRRGIDIVKGWKTPEMQALGDKQYRLLSEYGFEYDATLSMNLPKNGKAKPWPFTLDYGFSGKCVIPECPEQNYPGLWEVPVMAVKDYRRMFECGYVDGCMFNPPTRNDTFTFLWNNFVENYESNKAPFGINLRTVWFSHPTYLKNIRGLIDFLKRLRQHKDVYLVSVSDVIQWMKTPTKLSDISSSHPWDCNK